MAMKQMAAAASPDAYVAGLSGTPAALGRPQADAALAF